MKKTLMALAAAATLALTAMAPAPAEARGAGAAFGILGGLAAGALIAGAASNSYAYGPGYYAYGPRCWWTRQQVWDGYGYRWQRVRVCG